MAVAISYDKLFNIIVANDLKEENINFVVEITDYVHVYRDNDHGVRTHAGSASDKT